MYNELVSAEAGIDHPRFFKQEELGFENQAELGWLAVAMATLRFLGITPASLTGVCPQ